MKHSYHHEFRGFEVCEEGVTRFWLTQEADAFHGLGKSLRPAFASPGVSDSAADSPTPHVSLGPRQPSSLPAVNSKNSSKSKAYRKQRVVPQPRHLPDGPVIRLVVALEEVVFTCATVRSADSTAKNVCEAVAAPSDGYIAAESITNEERDASAFEPSLHELATQTLDATQENLDQPRFHATLKRAHALSASTPLTLAAVVVAFPALFDLPWTGHFRGFLAALSPLLKKNVSPDAN